MRSLILALLCYTYSFALSQVQVSGKWNIQCGISSGNGFRGQPYCVNLRYVSPRFKWSEEWNADEETEPDKYRNMRLMVELMYGPPFKIISTSLNAQYRLIKLKRFTTYISGGLKVLLGAGKDLTYGAGRNSGGYYMNMGLLSQFDLGRIAPFIDIGGDFFITVGTEIKLGKIYKKPRGRYKLKPISKE